MSEALSALTSGLSWIYVLVMFAAAAVALVKLRTTPSGLLLGAGFGLLAASNLASKIFHMTVMEPAMVSDVGVSEVSDLMSGFFACTNVAGVLIWLVIGAGALTLPLSLKRLAA